MEETGLPGENHPPVASHRQTSLYNVVMSTRGSNEQHAETIYLKIPQYEKWYQWDKGNTSRQIHGT